MYNFLIHIWQPLAGIVFFMMGIHFMDRHLRKFAGRNFKLWLKQQSVSKWKSLLGGSFFSAVMQSSSAVNLLVLTFIGSGIFTVEQALVWILGSNIGANITGWMLLFFGFSVQNNILIYIFSCLGGLAWLFIPKEHKLSALGGFILGLGMMLLGLMMIRAGITELLINQLSFFSSEQWSFFYLISGLLLTALLQSSAATLAIVMTLLHVQGIGFYAATCIILGSEIGTSTKLWLAAADGGVEKKKLALAAMLYNIIPALLIFPFLNIIIRVFFGSMLQDHALLALVVFQTLVNVFSAIIFLPFIKVLAKWLNERFAHKEDVLLFLNDDHLMNEAYLALEAFRNEVNAIYADVILLSVSFFEIKRDFPKKFEHHSLSDKGWMDKYNSLKEIHGKIREKYLMIQQVSEDKTQLEELERYISVARNCMYAAKSLKDIWDDRHQLMNSSNNRKYSFYMQARQKLEEYIHFLILGCSEDSDVSIDMLRDFYQKMSEDYELALKDLYGGNIHEKLSMEEISTMVNFNRELAAAVKSMFFACKSLKTGLGEESDDSSFPGFIR